MVDASQELLLEQLRQIRATQAVHSRKFDAVLHRLSAVEIGVAGLRRDQAGQAESVAYLQALVDRVECQIDRINQRLELSESPG